MRVVIIGLSITSSWGNGHATTYRGLARELVARDVNVVFAEHDVSWYRDNRDLPNPPYCRMVLHQDLADLRERLGDEVRDADAVIVGSYVPDGVAVGEWVTRTARGITAFYDIDTPITLAKMERGDFEYLSPDLIPRYHLYLSFAGGPTLARLEDRWGSRRALPFYCAVDPDLYYPEPHRYTRELAVAESRRRNPSESASRPNALLDDESRRRYSHEGGIGYELGYMGTYSTDRQPILDELLIVPASRLPERSFVVAGPQYPDDIAWSANIERVGHLSPTVHNAFYNRQRWTLNVTREDMRRVGWSPSVRLFEAAACGVPIISDRWEGIDSFLTPGKEILLADTAEEVFQVLTRISDEERDAVALAARARILPSHTAGRRAAELLNYLRDAV